MKQMPSENRIYYSAKEASERVGAMSRRGRRSRCRGSSLNREPPRSLASTFESIANAVSQMQEALLMMQLKMERTDIAVSGVARTLNEQCPVVESIEKRMTLLETSFNRTDRRGPTSGAGFSDGDYRFMRRDPPAPNPSQCRNLPHPTASSSGRCRFERGRPEHDVFYGADTGPSLPYSEPVASNPLLKGARWSPYHEQCVPQPFRNRSPSRFHRSSRPPNARPRSVSLGTKLPCGFTESSYSPNYPPCTFLQDYHGFGNVNRSYYSDPQPSMSFDARNPSSSSPKPGEAPTSQSPHLDRPDVTATVSSPGTGTPSEAAKDANLDSPKANSASSSATTSRYPEKAIPVERSVFATSVAQRCLFGVSGSSSSSSIFEGVGRYAPCERFPAWRSRSSTTTASELPEPHSARACALPTKPSTPASGPFVAGEKKVFRRNSVPSAAASVTELSPSARAFHSEAMVCRPCTSGSGRAPGSATTCGRVLPQHPISPKRASALGKNLLNASQEGRVDVVRELLDAGANADFTFGSDWTPLHRASARGHFQVVSLLLKGGANVQARVCGFTALHMAAYDDRTGRCVSYLLSSGADPNSRNNFGRTPLHYAAQCGNEAAVRALVASGASKNPKDKEGKTPLDLTKSHCVKMILIPYRGRQKSRCGLACRKPRA